MDAHARLVNRVMGLAAGDVQLNASSARMACGPNSLETYCPPGDRYDGWEPVTLAVLLYSGDWRITAAGAAYMLESWYDCFSPAERRLLTRCAAPASAAA